MPNKRFYVYRLFDQDGQTLYIGKGCGSRLAGQKRSHDCDGEILKRFARENAAFSFEKKLVERLRPIRNRVAGGGGGRAFPAPQPRTPKWVKEIEEIGSRRYAARMLLKFDLRVYLDPSKLEAIRQVANGPRC